MEIYFRFCPRFTLNGFGTETGGSIILSTKIGAETGTGILSAKIDGSGAGESTSLLQAHSPQQFFSCSEEVAMIN